MSKDNKQTGKKTAGEFFQTRMDALGVTAINNKIAMVNPEAESPIASVMEVPVFEEDNKGNICINFYDLNRQRITYYKKGKGKMSAHNQKLRNYQQIRLQFPKDDRKYLLPFGQGIFPFLPPLIIEAWRKKKSIHTLYLTEGAFKAWKACLYGVHTIGLTSITHYRDSETKFLHCDIVRLILKCQVQRIVILWDGDCRDISQKHLGELEDITRRPRGFFNAVKTIRALLLDIELPKDRPSLDIQFFHVKPNSFPDLPKGLDDIFIQGEKMGNAKKIAEELLCPDTRQQFFFFKTDITQSTTTLFHYFKLHEVHAFFHFHNLIIQNNRFKFQNDCWEWNEKKSKLKLVSPGWTEEIKWIGNNFYQEVFVPVSRGKTRRDLQIIKKQVLIDVYGKNFQRHLRYYKGFCNIPSHFNYQATHGDFYNSYRPLSYFPVKGDCSNTLEFIKHIFGDHQVAHHDQVYKNYELGLDYLQILLTEPYHPLPVLILYSPENNTGKSTFGSWQSTILGENAINVSNSDLKSDFNAHWVKKLLIYCEETLLEKQFDSEMIKAKSTSNKTIANAKGVNQYESEFFGKFQLYSNNMKMINLNKHDERYWIRQVPLPEKLNPDLAVVLEQEIPAFLHFIKNRRLKTPRTGRMHFATELIITSTFHQVVRINEPKDVKNLRENIKIMFLDFGQQEIKLPLNVISQEFFNNKVDLFRLREILSDYLMVDQLRNSEGSLRQVRSEYYRWERYINQQGDESWKKRTIKFKGRPFVFHRADFISKHEESENQTGC